MLDDMDDKKVVGYMGYEQHRQLKIALAVDEMTFSAWLRQSAESYIQSRLGGTLRFDPPKEG